MLAKTAGHVLKRQSTDELLQAYRRRHIGTKGRKQTVITAFEATETLLLVTAQLHQLVQRHARVEHAHGIEIGQQALLITQMTIKSRAFGAAEKTHRIIDQTEIRHKIALQAR